MKLSKSIYPFRLVAIFVIVLSISVFSSCSAADIQAVSDAVTALEKNKALAEQFVKDVKAEYDPADPQYRSLMGRYEETRDTYNDYISQIEVAARTGRAPTLPQEAENDIRQSAVSFISAATRSLDPHFDSRSMSLDRAITIPPNLPSSVTKLSGSTRKLLSDRFVNGTRWKSWSQLN
jgi:hypothetical protein